MKPRRKISLAAPEHLSEEEDAEFEAEEARLQAERLQKEIEEQNKFDCLCDGVSNCLSLVDSSFNELLELKDELLQHDLPPSLLVYLTLAIGKMFRSITDLHTPIQELTRLVNIYSIPWEQRSESLKKLHEDYESKQRQLNIAIRRLQLIDAHSRRLGKEKKIMNWEKAFAKVTSAKSHGRRWKFMIDAIKKKAKQGISLTDFEVGDSDEESEDGQDADELEANDDEATEKQRFMLSVIAASPPQDDDQDTPQVESDIESEADGIPSEMSDSTGNVDGSTTPENIKPRRRSVNFGVAQVEVVKEPPKPQVEDKGVWTHEPEYTKQLALRLFRPIGIKDDDGDDLFCTVTFEGNNIKTGVLPISLPPQDEDVDTVEDKGQLANRRKSIGFASRPTSPPPALSSPTSKSGLKPSSILKKVKSAEGEMNVFVDRSKYEEVLFEVKDQSSDPVRMAVLTGEQKMVSMATLPWSDIIEKDFISTMSNREEEETSLDEDLANQELLFLPLQAFKLGIGGHAQESMGQIPMCCYWVKSKVETHTSTEANTEGVRELVQDITGVDIEVTSKEQLTEILGREYNDMCTSAMSFASSSSNKSGYVPVSEMEVIKEQHDIELKNIQDEYELKLNQLLIEVERLQQTQPIPTTRMSPEVTFADNLAEQQNYIRADEEVYDREDAAEKQQTGQWRAPKIPNLPDWGAHLPKNVWVRMRMLTEEMVMKRQQLDHRIRTQIASNIEKKLASQYKLQKTDPIRGALQDVSLPAIFMPSKSGNVYNPRARMYFHPVGTQGDLRLTQPPSMFQLPPLPEKAKMSVLNLFELSKNFQHNNASDWMKRITSAPSRGSRVTTAGSRAGPLTPAPTAVNQQSDVMLA